VRAALLIAILTRGATSRAETVTIGTRLMNELRLTTETPFWGV
jgi:hypothetical protein